MSPSENLLEYEYFVQGKKKAAMLELALLGCGGNLNPMPLLSGPFLGLDRCSPAYDDFQWIGNSFKGKSDAEGMGGPTTVVRIRFEFQQFIGVRCLA